MKVPANAGRRLVKRYAVRKRKRARKSRVFVGSVKVVVIRFVEDL